jgi:hypothetical protein
MLVVSGSMLVAVTPTLVISESEVVLSVDAVLVAVSTSHMQASKPTPVSRQTWTPAPGRPGQSQACCSPGVHGVSSPESLDVSTLESVKQPTIERLKANQRARRTKSMVSASVGRT